LYIHLVESSRNPERAIPSAQRLMGIVPAAGHMVHMPGHIWLVTGDYANALAVNERAVEVDREYFDKTNVVTSSYYPYYLHNLQFVLYSRAMMGQLAGTRDAVKQFLTATAPMAQAMPDMVDLFNSAAVMAQLRMGMWDEILAAPQTKSTNPVAQSLYHFERALALAARGQTEDAQHEQAEFERA